MRPVQPTASIRPLIIAPVRLVDPGGRVRRSPSAVLRFSNSPCVTGRRKKLVTDAHGCRRKRTPMRIRVRTRIKRSATSRRNRRAGIACARRARDRPYAVRSMRPPRHPCNGGVAHKHESPCRYVRRLRGWLRLRTRPHRRCTRCARDWSTVEGDGSSNEQQRDGGEQAGGSVSARCRCSSKDESRHKIVGECARLSKLGHTCSASDHVGREK